MNRYCPKIGQWKPSHMTRDPILPEGPKSQARAKLEHCQITKELFWSISFLAPCPWPITNLQTTYEHNWKPFPWRNCWRNCCTHNSERGCIQYFALDRYQCKSPKSNKESGVMHLVMIQDWLNREFLLLGNWDQLWTVYKSVEVCLEAPSEKY